MRGITLLGIVLVALLLFTLACSAVAPEVLPFPEQPQNVPEGDALSQEPDVRDLQDISSEPPQGPIAAVTVEPEYENDTISISADEVAENWNVTFKFQTQDEDMNFMAYMLDGEIHVRANVCPPCRSIGFSLDDDILVCDRCDTLFEAKSGDGIRGACVDFPKASVQYDIVNGRIVMTREGLIKAYQDTLIPG